MTILVIILMIINTNGILINDSKVILPNPVYTVIDIEDNVSNISNINDFDKDNVVTDITENDITENDITENDITENDITENDITENITYTQEDLDAMALVIYQEAGGDACSDETRIMVGNVVLNRVNHPSFPNTIEEVLLQQGQYGRLYWTGLIWPDRAKYESDAVDRAYFCAQVVLEGEKLLPDDVIWQAEFPQGTEIVEYADGLYFCR